MGPVRPPPAPPRAARPWSGRSWGTAGEEPEETGKTEFSCLLSGNSAINKASKIGWSFLLKRGNASCRLPIWFALPKVRTVSLNRGKGHQQKPKELVGGNGQDTY